MPSHNLATVFATHLLCPRKLSADCLQTNHQLFIKATAFMIDQGPVLFTVPPQLARDVEMFWKSNSEKDLCESKHVFGPSNSPVVNTMFSFVDRQKTKEASLVSTTETALAELYAQVQSMPESAQKKRLINKLNEANGCGTPSVRGSTQKSRRRANDASSRLKNLLTPKSKTSALKSQKKEGKNHGSYNIDTRARKFDESEFATPVSSYKRQDSRGTSTLVTFTSDASPLLKSDHPPQSSSNTTSSKQTPKPLPPPRVSSLKKSDQSGCRQHAPNDQNDERDLLQTPRCRKPLLMPGLSPMLESPIPNENEIANPGNQSTTSSIIENEANLLLTGEMDPSESMTHFLDGGTNPNDSSDNLEENDSPNVATVRSGRKRSITELGGPNPLGKNKTTTPKKNVYFETDF